MSATLSVGRSLLLGGNYSYIHRDFAILPAPNAIPPLAFDLTDVPAHKAFVYVDWSPIERLHVAPSLEIASDRTVLASTIPTPPGIPIRYETSSYVNAGLRIDYEVIDGFELGIGGRVLFGDTYQLADGFPEQGRSFFASLRARFAVMRVSALEGDLPRAVGPLSANCVEQVGFPWGRTSRRCEVERG